METDPLSFDKVKSIIENLLFVAQRPLKIEDLVKATGLGENIIRDCLEELEKDYVGRGLQIIRVAHGWEMCTRHDYSDYVAKLLSVESEFSLSHAALETLAIVAYKQPTTRLGIENIRGVMSDGVLRTLLEKKLIKEVGRADSLGRPILYGTTDDFLKHFGLRDLTVLPPLPEGKEEVETFSKTLLPLEKEVQESVPTSEGQA